jgi:hypothetical protein
MRTAPEAQGFTQLVLGVNAYWPLALILGSIGRLRAGSNRKDEFGDA